MDLDVVVAVDVKHHQQQQAVETFAVFQRVATRIEGGADRPSELLDGRSRQRHVGRTA